MRKNRDKISILAAILEAANSGTCKTKIMQRANLNFQLLEKYLPIAFAAGFIGSKNNIYFLTSKGEKFLSRYRQYCDRCLASQTLVDALAFEYRQLCVLCNRTPR
jgi:predicted transcriptional regulator